MARVDRRNKLALDEAYRYYKQIQYGNDGLNVYRIAHCLGIINRALELPEGRDFKLTRRLWVRVSQALFDKLIKATSGYLVFTTADGVALVPGEKIPPDGWLDYHPAGFRRKEDCFRSKFESLYPQTGDRLAKLWQKKKERVLSRDEFAQVDSGEIHCDGDVCQFTPFVIGDELLQAESTTGKEIAYKEWWNLYLERYCTNDKREQATLSIRMDSLEAVFGNLNY